MVDSIRNSLNSLNIYCGLEDYILNTQIASMQLMANNLGVSQVVENLKHMADITSPINQFNNSAISQAMAAADSARRTMGGVVESNRAVISQAMTAADTARKMANSVVEPNMVAISQTLSSMDSMSETIKNLDSIFNNSAISHAAMILNAIQPQISFWNDWLNNNRQRVCPINNFF